jgi:capsule polysaccharide export protein KpsE/RkpR
VRIPPRWKRSDGSDRLRNHLHAEAIYERKVGDVTQIIERVRVSPTNAYERASYRLLEVIGDKATITALTDTLKEARAKADRHVVPILAAPIPDDPDLHHYPYRGTGGAS